MISAKELREGSCNKETVERGLILIDKLVRDNKMKRFVSVKLSKTFYNEFEFDAILKELSKLGYSSACRETVGEPESSWQISIVW